MKKGRVYCPWEKVKLIYAFVCLNSFGELDIFWKCLIFVGCDSSLHENDQVPSVVEHISPFQIREAAVDQPLLCLAQIRYYWTLDRMYNEDQYVLMLGGLHYWNGSLQNAWYRGRSLALVVRKRLFATRESLHRAWLIHSFGKVIQLVHGWHIKWPQPVFVLCWYIRFATLLSSAFESF